MEPPVITFNDRVEQITLAIRRKEKHLNRKYEVIYMMDNLVRENWGLVSDILTQMINILKKHDNHQLNGKYENYKWVQNRMHEKLKKVEKDCLENYRSLLNAREGVTINESLITLDEPLRHKMFEEFKDKLIDKLATFRDEVEAINPATNLDILKLRLEGRNEKAKKTSEQLHEKKTALASETLNLDAVYQDQIAELNGLKAQLFEDLKNPKNIFIAAQVGDLDYIKQAVKSKWFKASFVNEVIAEGENREYPPLQIAAYRGHDLIVEFLLKNGANLMATDKRGYQAIHWAAKAGSWKVVSCLLKAEKEKNGFLETVSSLFAKNESKKIVFAEAEYGRTPLHMAARNGRCAVAALLIEEGEADINAKAKGEGSITPLHEAVLIGYLDMVKTLTGYKSLDVMISDESGHSPVYYAVAKGFYEILECLLKHHSWKSLLEEDEEYKDPNNLSNLLKMTPMQNKEEIKRVLSLYYPADHL